MGFFATIGRGWKMSKLSMSVVGKDPELLVYMILAGVMSLVCLVGMGLPQFMEMDWAVNADGSFTPAYYGFTFVGYMLLSIVVVFWNCAIIANANIRLTGGDPKFADGVNAALKRLPIIIACRTLKGLEQETDGPGDDAPRDDDWEALEGCSTRRRQRCSSRSGSCDSTHRWLRMVCDDLLLEGQSVGDALKSSKTTFFSTWGENISSGLGIGLIAFLIGVPLVLVTIVLTVALGPFGLLFGALSIGLLIAWANAAEQVAVVALYRFAKDGQMPQLYQDAGMQTYTFGQAQGV